MLDFDAEGTFSLLSFAEPTIFSHLTTCIPTATEKPGGCVFSSLVQDNDVAVVKELMGHSDIRTTQKYLHFRMSHLAEVVSNRKKMIKLLENRSEVEAK
jgi:hypothetical protein